MHFVIYLPPGFYAAIAASVAEMLETLNQLRPEKPFSFEFVGQKSKAVSRSMITFQTRERPAKKIDVLLLLSGAAGELAPDMTLMDEEAAAAGPLIKMAHRQGAVLAASCGAAYALAYHGLLNGKKATISWWLKQQAAERFPAVHWEPSRMVIKQGKIYTSGGAYSGLDLMTILLVNLGYHKEERSMRKILVLPPSRSLQSPYELEVNEKPNGFEKQLLKLEKNNLQELDVPFLSKELNMSGRTLSRRFMETLQTSPGKWIQQRRIVMAKQLLETGKLPIAAVCFEVGYEDLASFTRLFTRSTGMTPSEYRTATRSAR